MESVQFRLTGVPPAEAIKVIDYEDDAYVSDVKSEVQEAYGLNPIVAIQFIYKGKVLPDDEKMSVFDLNQDDVVTVMATQAGG